MGAVARSSKAPGKTLRSTAWLGHGGAKRRAVGGALVAALGAASWTLLVLVLRTRGQSLTPAFLGSLALGLMPGPGLRAKEPMPRHPLEQGSRHMAAPAVLGHGGPPSPATNSADAQTAVSPMSRLCGASMPSGTIAEVLRFLRRRQSSHLPRRAGHPGALCTGEWRSGVKAYLKTSSHVRKPDKAIAWRTWQVCRRIHRLQRSLELAQGCSAAPLAQGPSASAAQTSDAPKRRSAAAREIAIGVQALPSPSARAGRSAVKDFASEAPGTELNELANVWGNCWPDGRPLSIGLKIGQVLNGSKFLVPAVSVEQLSKAKLHLAEAARLARRSNRVLVLPDAGGSRLMMGRPSPACSYLSLRNLAQRHITVSLPSPSNHSRLEQHTVEGGTPWISPDLFLMLLARHFRRRPTVGFLCLETKGLWPCLGHVEVVGMMEHILALSGGVLPDGKNTFYTHLPWHPDADPQPVQRLLNKHMAKLDIVILLKITPNMLGYQWPRPEHYADALLPYPRALEERAAHTARQIPRPFVALHFRSEFLIWQMGQWKKIGRAAAQMQQCVESAAALAQWKCREIQCQAVFIAADIPWTVASTPGRTPRRGLATAPSSPVSSSRGAMSSKAGSLTASGQNGSRAVPLPGAARSDSWVWMVRKYGHKHSLGPALSSLRRLRSLLPGSVMLEELDPLTNLVDSGETAIVDKLIAAQADVFLAGDKGCGGGRSYEWEILRMREQRGVETPVLRWPTKATTHGTAH